MYSNVGLQVIGERQAFLLEENYTMSACVDAHGRSTSASDISCR